MKIEIGQQIWLVPERTYVGYDVSGGKIVDVEYLDTSQGIPVTVLGTEEVILHFSEHETLHVFVKLLLPDGKTTLLLKGQLETHERKITSSTAKPQ